MSAPEFPAADLLHVARSKFLDAFAGVEEAILARLSVTQISIGSPMGHKIKALKALEPSPTFSKEMHRKLHETLPRLVELNTVRCDIAHAKLRAVRIDEMHYACFVNPQARMDLGLHARLLSGQQLALLATELRQMATTIRADRKVTRPSSPPRPSPGAAAGP